MSGLEGGEQAVELRSFRASGSHLPDASRDHLRMFTRSPNGSTPKSICTNSGNIQRSTLFYRKVLITGKFYGPSVRDPPTFPGLWRPRDWDGDVSNVRFDLFHGPRSHRLFRMHEKITLERPVTRDATRMKGQGSEGLGRPPGRERRTSKTAYFYSRSSIARSRCVLMLCEPLSRTRRRVGIPLRPPPSMFTFVRSLCLPRN